MDSELGRITDERTGLARALMYEALSSANFSGLLPFPARDCRDSGAPQPSPSGVADRLVERTLVRVRGRGKGATSDL